MKKIFLLLIAAVTIVACKNDDTDFSSYTNGSSSSSSTDPIPEDAIKVISITYNGGSVTVSGDDANYVTINGADVTVTSEIDSLLLILSGTTTDGSLLVNRQKKYGIKLNGVSINNVDGPAINNQGSKYLYLEVAGGTTNTLTDGTTYTEQVYDQKGAFFSEGEMYLYGTGTLNVTGNCRHAIACDDFIVIDDNVTLNVKSPSGSGIKVNDGLWINNGTIDINVTADAARGIRCDSIVVINYEDNTIDTILPERHVLMGKTYFYGKIISMLGNNFFKDGKAKGINGMMKYMMLSEMMKGGFGNSSSSGSGMNNLLPMMMFGGNLEGMFDGMFDFDFESELNSDEDEEFEEGDDLK